MNFHSLNRNHGRRSASFAFNAGFCGRPVVPPPWPTAHVGARVDYAPLVPPAWNISLLPPHSDSAFRPPVTAPGTRSSRRARKYHESMSADEGTPAAALGVRGHPVVEYNTVYEPQNNEGGGVPYYQSSGQRVLYRDERSFPFQWALSFSRTPENLDDPATAEAAADGSVPLGPIDWARQDEAVETTVTALATEAEKKAHAASILAASEAVQAAADAQLSGVTSVDIAGLMGAAAEYNGAYEAQGVNWNGWHRFASAEGLQLFRCVGMASGALVRSGAWTATAATRHSLSTPSMACSRRLKVSGSASTRPRTAGAWQPLPRRRSRPRQWQRRLSPPHQRPSRRSHLSGCRRLHERQPRPHARPRTQKVARGRAVGRAREVQRAGRGQQRRVRPRGGSRARAVGAPELPEVQVEERSCDAQGCS